MEVNFVDFDEVFLELSWTWLNDPENKFLTSTPDITKAQQLEWYNSLPNRNDYLIWGVTADIRPVGVAGLKRIVNDTAFVFWYIGDKEFWGKRIGVSIATKITEISRSLCLKVLFAEIIFENFRSINLFFKVGYKIVSVGNGCYIVRKDLE